MNNAYAKLAPDTLQNENIKGIMRYTGDTGHPHSIILQMKVGILYLELEKTVFTKNPDLPHLGQCF